LILQGETQKRYETYGYVLDFRQNSVSKIIKNKGGTVVEALGGEFFMILELLANPNTTFGIQEKVYISKEKRNKIASVLGRMKYSDLSSVAKNELPAAVEKSVMDNEARFVAFFNQSQPITPRLNALELIPGIGKTLMRQMLEEREKKPFTSFEDIQKRIGLKDPGRRVAERVLSEIISEQQVYLFVR
jgi:putative nucleotide binding protein